MSLLILIGWALICFGWSGWSFHRSGQRIVKEFTDSRAGMPRTPYEQHRRAYERTGDMTELWAMLDSMEGK